MAPQSRGDENTAPGKRVARTWSTLQPSLSEWILEAVESMGFSRMTPVQASTIPLFMGNKDVVVEAVTGSGKTLAFLIPIVERLLRLDEPTRRHHVGAIVISPTRELATQIHAVLLSLLAYHPPSSALLAADDERIEQKSVAAKIVPQLLVGGLTAPSQDLAHFLKHSPNLIVSTPGRLVELLSSPHVHCPQSSFEALVLDEADRLLDFGFKEDLQKVLQRLPKQRRTGLFSASVSEAVDELVRLGLRNPVRIAVKVKSANGIEEQRTPSSLKMTYMTMPPTHKLPALLRLVRNLEPLPNKTLAYVSTCAAVDYFQHLLPVLSDAFEGVPLTIVPLHGKQTPQIRTKNFNRFLTTPTPVLLLTTDVAARGLDIPAVDLTVQLDPPSDPKTFLHRAGRAGRAGREGLSVVFLLPGRESTDYPPFLSVRKTPVEPLNDLLPTLAPNLSVEDSEAREATAKMRRAVLRDRGLHEKAQKAFVSWVRSYGAHTASSIFRTADLDWAGLADAWALLRLPKMPELKRAKAGSAPADRGLGLEVDWDAYAYKDLKKENKRKAEMDNGVKATPVKKRQKSRGAWSDKIEHAEQKKVRREQKEAKRAFERRAKMTADERAKQDEVDAMVKEIRSRNLAAADGRETEFNGFDD